MTHYLFTVKALLQYIMQLFVFNFVFSTVEASAATESSMLLLTDSLGGAFVRSRLVPLTKLPTDLQ